MKSNREQGFSIIQSLSLTVVILILVAVVIFRLWDFDTRHHKSNIQASHAEFSQAVQRLHTEWEDKGKPDFLMVKDTVIPMTKQGWPGQRFMTEASCQQLWITLLDSAPTTNAWPYSFDSEGYAVLASGNLCYFVYQKLPKWSYLYYDVISGEVFRVNA